MVNTVSKAILDGWVGKGVSAFCENDFSAPSQNHCAHFVSHVYGMAWGKTCGSMAAKKKSGGTTIRVHELYNKLRQRGKWDAAPANKNGVLVFLIAAGNVKHNIMANVSKKHVGIIWGGAVYNFANLEHKVVRDMNVDTFLRRINNTYHEPSLAMFYGVAQ